VSDKNSDEAGLNHRSGGFARLLSVTADWPTGSLPNTCSPHSFFNQPTLTFSSEKRRLASGTACSPSRMPNSPISAITGGAGERTFSNP